MKRTIIVCGHGNGISDAVARKFGAAGHPVALVARNGDRLVAAAAALKAANINAAAFPCDLGQAEAVRALVKEIRGSLGPIGIVHWNAYASGVADLTTANIADIQNILNVSVTGLIAAVQESLPDLREAKGSVLVTGGGFAMYDPRVDEMATNWASAGLAIGKAAQHKTVGLLYQRLKKEGVYVGEVVVMGTVKGTAFDAGSATLEAASIADKFWELNEAKSEMTVQIR